MSPQGEYAPQFYNNLLYLPDGALSVLLAAGLDQHVIEAARHGLSISDRDIDNLAEISASFEQVITRISTDD